MALQRIEVLGPSGVGKSTVLNAVMRKRAELRGGQWFFPDDLTPVLERIRKGTTAGERLCRAVDGGMPEPFFRTCFGILAGSQMQPSQRFSAIAMVRKSCEDLHELRMLGEEGFVVHDELLLHRAFSLLPGSREIKRDARDYFESVPAPGHAFILKADAEVIRDRVMGRSRRPNCYRLLADADLLGVIERLLTACDIAAEVLVGRGVGIHILDANRSPHEVGEQIVEILNSLHPAQRSGSDSLMDRLLEASGSFRKKEGRHHLKRQQVAYCSFSTPAVTVPAEMAQRNAVRRLARFDLGRSQVEGRSILDLGCNSGAMLFELSNRAPRSGLGIEYDQDKVELAREIASLSDLDRLEFRQSDIDALSEADLGQFDIVLALAIEAHVMDPDKLLRMIAAVTRHTLYFEGNGGCDVEGVAVRLLELGFSGVCHLGLCDDDSRPSNNNRPLLKAWKLPQGSV